MISDRFQVNIFGDLEYDDLVADIYFDDQIVAMLTQEKGYENLEIEVYSPKDQDFWVFKFLFFSDIHDNRYSQTDNAADDCSC